MFHFHHFFHWTRPKLQLMTYVSKSTCTSEVQCLASNKYIHCTVRLTLNFSPEQSSLIPLFLSPPATGNLLKNFFTSFSKNETEQLGWVVCGTLHGSVCSQQETNQLCPAAPWGKASLSTASVHAVQKKCREEEMLHKCVHFCSLYADCLPYEF